MVLLAHKKQHKMIWICCGYVCMYVLQVVSLFCLHSFETSGTNKAAVKYDFYGGEINIHTESISYCDTHSDPRGSPGLNTALSVSSVKSVFASWGNFLK